MRHFLIVLGLLALSACARTLPPPNPALLTAACAPTPMPVGRGTGADDALLFATTRLPDCRIQPYAMTPDRSETMRLGWFDTSGAGKPGDPIVPYLAGEEDWWAKLEAQLVTGKGRVLLFVHGFNNDFNYPAFRLGMMRVAGEFNGPAILFSWPSQNALLKYSWDETNIDWSQAYLNVMIRRLARNVAVREIVLVGHSMGSRSVIDAMEALDATALAKVKTVILASPDVDRDRFAQIIQGIPGRAAVGGAERHYTVYVSAKDSAVAISRRLHHYPRLGTPYCADRDTYERCYPKSSPALDVVDTTAVSKSDFGHADFLDSPEAVADLTLALRGRGGALPGRLPVPAGPDGIAPGDGIWRLCPVAGCPAPKVPKAKKKQEKVAG